MKKRYPFWRLHAEALALRTARLLIPLLPRRLVVALAGALGGMAYALSGRDRRVALANLETVLGDAHDAAACRAIARQAFCTMVLLGLDFLWFSVRTGARLRRYTRLDDSGDLPSGSAIGVAAHLGNWEILGHMCALHYGSITSVAAELRNPRVNRLVLRMRQASGQRVIPQRGAIRELMRSLRAGGVAALLVDQNTLPAKGGIFVDFFGRPVPITRAVAALQLRTAAPVYFSFSLPDARGIYTLYCRKVALPAEGQRDERAVTQAVADTIEAAIRENPGRWMWMYKRWKFIPEGADAARYPGYARPIEAGEL